MTILEFFKQSEWGLDPKDPVLIFKGNGYWIDLRECRSSACILNWIFQVQSKSWATPKVMSDLLSVISILLDPQKNMCVGGHEQNYKGDLEDLMQNNLDLMGEIEAAMDGFKIL